MKPWSKLESYTMNKYNESRTAAEKKGGKLLKLLEKPLKKKLRKEYDRAQEEAVKIYSEKRYIPSMIWRKHQDELYDIYYEGLIKSQNAGFKRIINTFKKAGWVDNDDIVYFEKELKNDFLDFSSRSSEKLAFEAAETTRKQLEFIIKKKQDQEQSAKIYKVFNAFEEIISDILKEAKQRSIWRSVVGALTVAHAGASRASTKAANKTVQEKRFNIFKIWVTEKDEKVRTSHRLMEGVMVYHNEPFQVSDENGMTYSMEYPGDTSAPIELWIKCRCEMRYEREKK